MSHDELRTKSEAELRELARQIASDVVEHFKNEGLLLIVRHEAGVISEKVVEQHIKTCPLGVQVKDAVIKYALWGLVTMGTVIVAVGAMVYGAVHAWMAARGAGH